MKVDSPDMMRSCAPVSTHVSPLRRADLQTCRTSVHAHAARPRLISRFGHIGYVPWLSYLPRGHRIVTSKDTLGDVGQKEQKTEIC